MAGVLFGVAVVVDANKQNVVCIFSYLGWVLLPTNLVNGCIGILVDFQLKNDGGRVYMFAGNEYYVR